MKIFVIGQTTLHWDRMEFGNIGNYYIIEPFVRELHKIFSNATIKTTLQMSERFCDNEKIKVVPMELYYGCQKDELELALTELAIAQLYAKTGDFPLKTPYINEVMRMDIEQIKQKVKFEKLWSEEKHFIRLSGLLWKLDGFYIPKISECVDINKYSKKLLKNAEVFALVLDTEDIGIIAVYVNDKIKNTAFISSIGLFPDYQNKGFGYLLMKKIQKVCSQNGMNKVRLEVGKKNQNVIYFYKKYGFEIISEKKDDPRFFNMVKKYQWLE